MTRRNIYIGLFKSMPPGLEERKVGGLYIPVVGKVIGSRKVLGWSPAKNANTEKNIEYDISLERPLEGMRKNLDGLLTSRGKRSSPNIQGHIETLLSNTINPLIDPLIKIFIKVVNGEVLRLSDVESGVNLQLGPAIINSIQMYVATSPSIRDDRAVDPQPGPPIISKRDMTASTAGSSGVWYKQVRRLPSEKNQVDLIVRLGHEIRSWFLKQSSISIQNASQLALTESDSIKTKMVIVASNLYKGLRFESTPDLRLPMETALSENQNLRALAVVLASLNICELAACSTSYRAIRLASAIATDKEATLKDDKSANHIRSATVYSQGAVDLTYDMINTAFQTHLERIFTQVTAMYNDRLQQQLDKAMFELMRASLTQDTNAANAAKNAANICTVVVAHFRMLIVISFGGGGGRETRGSGLIEKILGLINRLTPNNLSFKNFHFQISGFGGFGFGKRKGITIADRNKAMRLLYAAHGTAIRFHPIDVQGFVMGKIANVRGALPTPGRKSSFFSVHAPLCVMCLDFAFVPGGIQQYAHVKKKIEGGGYEAYNPSLFAEFADLLAVNPVLLNRCKVKLGLERIDNLVDALFTPDTAKETDSALRRAGRIVYNAIMATDQFIEIDENARQYYMRSREQYRVKLSKNRGTLSAYRTISGGNFQASGNATVQALNERLANLNSNFLTIKNDAKP